jgi:hypothetical protein
MATARTPKPDAPADGVTANGPDVSDVQVISHAQPQVNEKVTGMISTNPPRGVDELPSDHIADEPSAAATQSHVHKIIDEETARGYRGERKSKPVPNKNYTLAGVNAGLPTPETVVHTPVSE